MQNSKVKSICWSYIKTVWMQYLIFHSLSPIRAAEIAECVRKYVYGISQNLQNLSPAFFTMSSRSLLKSQIIELNKLISASQPILANRCEWIDFIQSKGWILSNFLFSLNPS